MNLKKRLERLETARGKGAPEFTIIRRIIPGGELLKTEIKDGRIVRRELTPEEAARLSAGAVKIGRTYRHPDERST